MSVNMVNTGYGLMHRKAFLKVLLKDVSTEKRENLIYNQIYSSNNKSLFGETFIIRKK